MVLVVVVVDEPTRAGPVTGVPLACAVLVLVLGVDVDVLGVDVAVIVPVGCVVTPADVAALGAVGVMVEPSGCVVVALVVLGVVDAVIVGCSALVVVVVVRVG